MFTSGILSVILAAQAAPLPKLVGTLSVTAGKVRLERSGRDPEWAGKYVRLRIGDKLTVVEKPKATLRIDFSRETFRLPEKGAWLVQERSLKVLDGAAPTLIHREAVRRQVPGAKPPAMAGRIRGGEGSLMPMGAVASSPVTMSWSRAAGAKKSQVELLDTAGKKIWSKDAGSAVSMALPSDKLKPGVWFQVRVVQSGAGNPSVASTWIRLLSAPAKSALEGSEQSLRAALLEDSVALGEALGELWASAGMVSRLPEALKLISAGADWEKDPELLSKLGTWLESAGFTGAARTEYERAWAAGGREPELKESIERLGGKAEPEEWEKLAAERDRLMKEQKFQDALPLAQRVIEFLRKEKPGSVELGEALTSVGDLLERLGQLDEADKVLAQALAVLAQVDGSDTYSIAEVQVLQGFVANGQRNFLLAQEKWEAACELFEKIAPTSQVFANTLVNLGIVARSSRSLELAQHRYEQAIAVYQEISSESQNVAALLNELGLVARAKGDYRESYNRHNAALNLARRLDPESLEVANILNNLGILAFIQGDLIESQRNHAEALRIREKKSPDSLDVASSLNNLGNVASAKGDLESAHRLLSTALEISERRAKGSMRSANLLSNLGIVCFELGDLELAQIRHEAALAIRERLVPESLDVAISLDNLGTVALYQGDLLVAQRLYEAALALRNKLSPDSLDVATTLNGLGLVALARKDLIVAQKSFLASLAIKEKFLSASRDVAATIGNLGAVSAELADYEQANLRFSTALAMFERLAPESLDVARVFINLGNLSYDMRDYSKARDWLQKAMVIQERLAPNSLEMVSLLGNQTTVSCAEGIGASMVVLMERKLSLITSLIRNQGKGQMIGFGAYASEATDALARTGWLQDPAAFYPYLPTLRAAGLTLQTRAKISELAAETDEEVRKARSAVQIATKQETDWATNPRPKEMDEKDWDNELLDRRAKRQSAELKLATLLKEKDPRLASDLKVNLEDIQKNLAPDTAVIEFLRVSTWDDKAKKPGPDAYGAFIVRNQGDVKFVRLGDAEETDALVEEWHVQIALANDPNASEAVQKETEKQLRALGRKLHDRLIKPLGRLPVNVMLAPDASLHSFPFAALVDGKGKYLLETKVLSVVGSGRDLVEKPLPGEPGEIAVFAAPNFGADAQAVEAAGAKASEKIGTTRSFNARGTWDPLPSAAAEGNAVGKLLGVQPIEGAEATEERLLGLVRPRVLHIATHGFFFPPTIDRNDREEMRMTEMIGSGIRVADNPMLRSGLILAGANNDAELRKAGLADGWATALEISLMDLRGTELVVLSACDTGRGQSVGSEGVFGLQRAFRFAGAQTLIVSLFKVPDDSTQALMAQFYNAWKPGSPAGTKLASLRATQLQMLKNPTTRHPRHWAAFVLMGDR